MVKKTPDQATSDPPSAEYEFDGRQTKIISELASAMRWVSAPLLLLGILYVIATVVCVVHAFRNPATSFAAVYVGLISLLFLLLGRWTKDAATCFQHVVWTTGHDIEHLMNALDNLRKKYSLLSTFVKVYVAISLVAVIVGLVMTVTGTLSR
jgi:hypothetical protein